MAVSLLGVSGISKTTLCSVVNRFSSLLSTALILIPSLLATLAAFFLSSGSVFRLMTEYLLIPKVYTIGRVFVNG